MNPSVGVVFRILTLGDKALIGLLTLFSLMSLGFFYQGSRPGQAVIVSVEGKETLRKELSENKSFNVRGATGSMTLSIEDSSIRVTASSCRQHPGFLSVADNVIIITFLWLFSRPFCTLRGPKSGPDEICSAANN